MVPHAHVWQWDYLRSCAASPHSERIWLCCIGDLLMPALLHVVLDLESLHRSMVMLRFTGMPHVQPPQLRSIH